MPEGHRTTYVVGLIDMVDMLTQHVGQEKKSRLNSLRQYARPLTGDELRKLMDDYMDTDVSHQQYAAASNLLAALAEKCP